MNKIIQLFINMFSNPEKIAYKEAYNKECIELAKEQGVKDAKKKYKDTDK